MSAGGTLTQLVALGAQNTYLTGEGTSFRGASFNNSAQLTFGCTSCGENPTGDVLLNNLQQVSEVNVKNITQSTSGAYICDAIQKKCIFINDINNTNNYMYKSLAECEKTCQ